MSARKDILILILMQTLRRRIVFQNSMAFANQRMFSTSTYGLVLHTAQ